jgi:hypothetical protein
MPICKNASPLTFEPTLSHFDNSYPHSASAPYSGIYHCTNCGYEIAVSIGKPLAPSAVQDPQHQAFSCVPNLSRWVLVAEAITDPKWL